MRAITRYRLSGHFDRQGQAANAVAYGEPDPQNARPEEGSYLELWCCLLVFRERIGKIINYWFYRIVFSDRTQLVSARETQLVSACVWTWDTASLWWDKNVLSKRHGGINMIVASEHQTKLRQKEIQEIDRKASKKSMRRRRRIATSPRHTQGLATH